jgi:HK97 family phage prohead protease
MSDQKNRTQPMKTKTHFDVQLKIKSVSETGEFEGYASVFGEIDSHSDVVISGAFVKSLAKWAEKGRMPAMLWQHKIDEPIGIYMEIREDENGLYVKGRLLIDADPLAKRAHAHLKAGSITGLSIGYTLVDWEWSKEKEVWILKEIDLWEVSLVTFPSGDSARVTDVKAAFERGETPAPKLIEKILRDAGMSRQQAKSFMSKGYNAIDNQREADIESGLNALKALNF